MKQELRFNGYTAQPSDYECQDGDLAAVLNLMPEKGALHPVSEPSEVISLLSDTSTVYFIHTVTSGEKKIISRAGDDDFYWQDMESNQRHMLWGTGGYDCYQVSAIGNTLCILGEYGVAYFLWKSDTETYTKLGIGLPEISLSFGLQSKIERTEPEAFTLAENIPFSDLTTAITQRVDLSDSNKAAFTSGVLAKVNRFIAEKATNAGKFIMPFFVRYALRLYDGSLVHHSAPIFMPCASDVSPIALYGGDTNLSAEILVLGVVHDLVYKASVNSSMWTKLMDWKDIVVSVDIFISAPLYKYDQAGEIAQIGPTPSNMWSLSMQMDQDQALDYDLRYQMNSIRRMYKLKYGSDVSSTYPVAAMLPSKSDDDYQKAIQSCSNFYLLKSIPIEELSQESRVKINVPDDYLPSLVNREVMTDDYDSHDLLIPRTSFVYNQRINLANLKKSLFTGFDAFSSLAYSDGFVSENGGLNDDVTYDVNFYVYVKKDGKTFILKDSLALEGAIAFGVPFLYFYYPFTAAYKVVVKRGNNGWEFPLKPHAFLNGAVYSDPGYRWYQDEMIQTAPVPSEDLIVEIPNKIYTSDIGNPFLFPLLGITTVGTGRIIGLSTAAKALSEGQFGQFPLYAFSGDGVWALEVSSTGSFSARQPITRDVCINPDSITQIDSAVLFATDRGIMLISGSQVICITEVMDNDEDPFNFTTMPLAASIQALLGTTGTTVFPEKPFTTAYLAGCQMLYAYNRQCIIVFNPSYAYAYIYSLESKMWGMMRSNIESRIISYPESFAWASKKIVDYSDEKAVNNALVVKSPQFLITRPIKLDPSLKDIHKTIDTIIARGQFVKGHVKMVLYGSRDLSHWFPVASSVDHYLRGFRGTPYKYFRIALICTLTHDESIWGCTIQYTPRLLNQPR